MKYILSLLLLIALIPSCKNASAPGAGNQAGVDSAAAPDSLTAPASFFPVADYIGGQLKIIDSLQLPISKTVIVNQHEALSAATDTELRAQAQQFRSPDINDPALKAKYTQTSIADQSVPSVTLIFSTADTSLVIQKINVYVKPDPVNNDKVTGVYMEKRFYKADTLYNQKLIWKTDKNMQVITEKKVNGKTLPVEQVKISWSY
ncbi:MAG TPA: hypothetical protein VL307_06540 [Chitinophagaceae bacterium]|nr:hypothetical protein [Chitinophagaceae bacterium]